LSFIENLHKASRPFAEKEYAEISALAKAEGLEGNVERWDWAYYTEKLKAQKAMLTFSKL